MTFVAVLLLGGGVLLIISSLDNTPIITTAQKIAQGKSINYSGTTPTSPTPAPQKGSVTQSAATPFTGFL